MPSLPYLDHDTVRDLLPMAECIDVMEHAFASLAHGDAVQPLRAVVHMPGGRGSLYAMPAYVGTPRSLAVKLIGIYPGNAARGLETHRGVVLVFDPDDGGVDAILDAAALTAVRTAAVSALATRILAREDARVLAILGSGVQAGTHLEAMRLVRPIRHTRVWSRNSERLRRFVRRAQVHGDEVIEAATSAREAVEGADIVCTVTSSRTAVLEAGWLARGVHINAVGASTSETRELDTETVRRARMFVDQRAAALAEAGDILGPIAEGAIGPDAILADLGDLVLGRVEGRETDRQITVFKSLGLAIEDAAAAYRVVRNARKRGRIRADD